MNSLVEAFAGVTSGTLGAMGMGGGGILIIYLTIFANVAQRKAQGINLIFFIPMALVSIFVYARKKLIEWKIAIPACVAGMTGALIGAWLSSIIDGYWLSKIFAVLLFLIGLKQLFGKYEKKSA